MLRFRIAESSMEQMKPNHTTQKEWAHKLISENRTSSKRTEQLTWKQDVKRRASDFFSHLRSKRKNEFAVYTLKMRSMKWGEIFGLHSPQFKNKTSGWMKTVFEVKIEDQHTRKPELMCAGCKTMFLSVLWHTFGMPVIKIFHALKNACDFHLSRNFKWA